MRLRPARILLIVIALLASVSTGLACRYNVRETGFVDFGLDSYQLLCFVNSEIPEQLTSELPVLAQDILADSCVGFGLVSTDEQPDHPALALERPIDDSGPSAALVSSTGRTLWLGPVTVPTDDRPGEGLVRVVSSPVRLRIAEKLATAFAVVLLVEGKNQAENSSVERIVDEAIEILDAELEYFPKPIKKGPVVVKMTQDEAASEEILLWTLGLTSEDLDRPAVAVLYGIGRWIGPLMVGEEITLGLLSRILFLVGADCECDLDPRMLRGTGIPIPWNERLHSIVTQDLGFDPNNPLVRMEVSQIMRVRAWQYQASDDRTAALDIPEQPPVTKLPSNSLGLRLLVMIGSIAAIIVAIGGLILFRARRQAR